MLYGDGLYGAGPYGGSRRPPWWTHRLAASLNLDPSTTQPVIEVQTWDGTGWVTALDLSATLEGYSVTYGRRDAGSPPDPVSAVLTFARRTDPPQIATRVRLRVCDPVATALGLGDSAVRFTGEVTDPSVDWHGRRTQVVAVGRLGRAYRQSVDGTLWPTEDDGDRIARILEASGATVGTIDPGAATLAPHPRVDSAAALTEAVSTSALGVLVEQTTGACDWHDSEHRRAAPVAVTLDAADVFHQVTWSQRLSSLVNHLAVKLADEEVQTTTDTESAAVYGLWPGSAETLLTTTGDAYDYGVGVVARRADPSWSLPDLTVDLLRTVDTSDLPGVLGLRLGSLVAVTGLPAEFPVPGGRMFVEGYTETATPRAWRLAVAVSDPRLSGTGLRWIDWPDTTAYQWTDLAADLTWFDLARITDPSDTL